MLRLQTIPAAEPAAAWQSFLTCLQRRPSPAPSWTLQRNADAWLLNAEGRCSSWWSKGLSRAKLLYHMMSALLLHRLMMLMLANVLKALTSIQNHTTSLLFKCLEPPTYFLCKPSWSRSFPHCSWNRRARWVPPRPSPDPKSIYRITFVTSSASLDQSANRLNRFEPSWSFWVRRRRTAWCSSSDPASELPGSQTAPPSGPSSGPERW